MQTTKFKTNIKCANCIAQVTPQLNATVGEGNWSVDINNPEKILTVEGERDETEEVQKAINEAGYKAEKVTA